MPQPFPRTTRALALDTGHAAVGAWAIAGLGLAVWLAWFCTARIGLVEPSRQARLEQRQAGHALTALAGGRVLRSTLALGRQVAAGEVLVEFDASTDALRLREEQAHAQALARQLDALQREIDAHGQGRDPARQAALAAVQGAEARVREAAATAAYAADRARRLHEDHAAGGIAQAEWLQAEAEARRLAEAHEALAAEGRRQGAEALAQSAQRSGQQDGLARQRAALQGELAVSTAAIARLAREVDDHRLRAPVAGRLGEAVALRDGEVVAAGQRLATLVPEADSPAAGGPAGPTPEPDGGWVIVADFEPATALGRLQPGQPATLRLDGFPWARHGSLAATVSRVATEPRDHRLRVELAPRGPWPRGLTPQHGLSGAVEVEVEALSPAALVLRACGQWLSAGAGVAP